MPVLSNSKHELFAQSLARGLSASAAYVEAGYSANEGNAVRLKGNERVQQRVRELQEASANDTVMTLQELKEFLTAAKRTSIEDIGPDHPLCQEYTVDQVGGGTRGKLKRGQADEGNEVETPEVHRIKTKAVCKIKAVDMLAKLQGWYAPKKVEIEGGLNVTVTDAVDAALEGMDDDE